MPNFLILQTDFYKNFPFIAINSFSGKNQTNEELSNQYICLVYSYLKQMTYVFPQYIHPCQTNVKHMK